MEGHRSHFSLPRMCRARAARPRRRPQLGVLAVDAPQQSRRAVDKRHRLSRVVAPGSSRSIWASRRVTAARRVAARASAGAEAWRATSSANSMRSRQCGTVSALSRSHAAATVSHDASQPRAMSSRMFLRAGAKPADVRGARLLSGRGR